MKTKLDTIERFQAIITNQKKGTVKELEQLERYRFCHSLFFRGFSKTVVAQQLMKREEQNGGLSFPQAAKLTKESLEILGSPDESIKQGLKYAAAENMLRLARKAEKKGDFPTARLYFNDAYKLQGLDQISDGGVENPEDYMQPAAFVIIKDPKFINRANKMIQLEWEEAKEVNPEEDDDE